MATTRCAGLISGRRSCSIRFGQGKADQAAAVLGHEVDGVRGRHLGRDHQVALVLAVLVVDQDEHAAVARLFDDLFDRRTGTPKVDRAQRSLLRR